MRNVILIVILSVLLFGCKTKEKEESNEFILLGNFETDNELVLTLEELTTSELLIIDSIKTNDSGKFFYKNRIDDAGFYLLRERNDNFVTLLIEPGERIELSGNIQNIPESYNVSGSKGSELLLSLNKELRSNIIKVDSLADLYRESFYKHDFEQIHHELNIEFTNIFENQKQHVTDFIKENPYSLASIMALYQYFGDRAVLREREDFEFFEKLSKTLAKKYPANKHVIDLKKRVSEIKRRKIQRQIAEEKLAAGNPSPDIVLPDQDGEPVELSSLKGNIVLIYFWASWHEPCKAINERLSELYDKYGSKDFEIFAVSLDRTRDQWIQAIYEDNLDCIHVSDLRYFNSPVVNLYNIESIPHTVLIDKKGKIIDRGFDLNRLGEYLEELL